MYTHPLLLLALCSFARSVSLDARAGNIIPRRFLNSTSPTANATANSITQSTTSSSSVTILSFTTFPISNSITSRPISINSSSVLTSNSSVSNTASTSSSISPSTSPSISLSQTGFTSSSSSQTILASNSSILSSALSSSSISFISTILSSLSFTSSNSNISTITNSPLPVQTVSTTVNGQPSEIIIIGGIGTAPPITLAPTITISPTGAAASSSRSAIQTQLSSSAFILIEGWINNPERDAGPVIQGLDDTENLIKGTLSDLSSSSDKDTSKGCTHSLFSILSCIASALTNIKGMISGITDTVTDDIINTVKSDLSDLEDLTTELEENKEDDQSSSDATSNSSPSNSGSSSSSSSECTQTSVAQDKYVICSPSQVTRGTITTTTQICSTDTSTVSGCTVSTFATTSTVSSAASTATLVVSADWESDDTAAEVAAMAPSIASYLVAGLACLTTWELPFPTACAGVGGGSGSGSGSNSSNSSNNSTSSASVMNSSSQSLMSVSTTAGNLSSSITSSSSIMPSSSSSGITRITSPPPVTSCALSSASAWSINGDTIPATILCSCNDGWMAAIGTTVGSDQSTTYTCAAGLSTYIAVSTAPPASTMTTQTSTSQTPTSTLPQPTPLESCHTQYAAFFDEFDIYGFDWDASKLDAGGAPGSGNGLHSNIGGCSVVTKWKFDILSSSDSPWGFHASGRTTIWQKNCIEDAIASSGAPTDSCNGSG